MAGQLKSNHFIRVTPSTLEAYVQYSSLLTADQPQEKLGRWHTGTAHVTSDRLDAPAGSPPERFYSLNENSRDDRPPLAVQRTVASNWSRLARVQLERERDEPATMNSKVKAKGKKSFRPRENVGGERLPGVEWYFDGYTMGKSQLDKSGMDSDSDGQKCDFYFVTVTQPYTRPGNWLDEAAAALSSKRPLRCLVQKATGNYCTTLPRKPHEILHVVTILSIEGMWTKRGVTTPTLITCETNLRR
ncbi:unnamed protein product, partial [Iphiclides podalirius]